MLNMKLKDLRVLTDLSWIDLCQKSAGSHIMCCEINLSRNMEGLQYCIPPASDLAIFHVDEFMHVYVASQNEDESNSISSNCPYAIFSNSTRIVFTTILRRTRGLVVLLSSQYTKSQVLSFAKDCLLYEYQQVTDDSIDFVDCSDNDEDKRDVGLLFDSSNIMDEVFEDNVFCCNSLKTASHRYLNSLSLDVAGKEQGFVIADISGYSN